MAHNVMKMYVFGPLLIKKFHDDAAYIVLFGGNITENSTPSRYIALQSLIIALLQLTLRSDMNWYSNSVLNHIQTLFLIKLAGMTVSSPDSRTITRRN